MADHSTVATSAVRPNEPAHQVIATFDNFAEAERAVGYLSDQRFEVNQVAIVGGELEYVKPILGRMNDGTAALRGQRGFHPISGLRPKYYDAVEDARLPTARCNTSPADTGRNRRWQQR